MIKVISNESNGVQLFPTFQGDTLQWPNKALTGLFIPPLNVAYCFIKKIKVSGIYNFSRSFFAFSPPA